MTPFSIKDIGMQQVMVTATSRKYNQLQINSSFWIQVVANDKDYPYFKDQIQILKVQISKALSYQFPSIKTISNNQTISIGINKIPDFA